MLKQVKFGQRKSHPHAADRRAANDPRPMAPELEKRRAYRRAHWCVSYVYSYDDNDPAPRDVREAIVLDVNEFGVRLRSRSRAAYSGHVLVTAARLGLRRTGRVVWQAGFDAGIEFD